MNWWFGLVAMAAMALGGGQASTRPAAQSAPREMELVLLVGQSNMAGRGAVDEESKRIDPRVWMLDQGGAWVPATDPVHFDKPTMVGVGPGLTAGKVLAEKWGKPVGLVPAAMGGSSIEEWKADGKLYPEAIRRMKLAMAHGHLRAILWHQGESNSGGEKPAKYAGQLEELVARFRRDLDSPGVPFVIGEIGNWKGTAEKFNAMVREYPKTHPDVACVSAEGLADKGDKLHFSTAGARELGRRYAAAVVELEGKAGK